MSSWWLQMAWRQIGTRPSATTMVTLLWLKNTIVAHASYYAIYIHTWTARQSVYKGCSGEDGRSVTRWFVCYWWVRLFTAIALCVSSSIFYVMFSNRIGWSSGVIQNEWRHPRGISYPFEWKKKFWTRKCFLEQTRTFKCSTPNFSLSCVASMWKWTWWRHGMNTFSALLCGGYIPITKGLWCRV